MSIVLNQTKLKSGALNDKGLKEAWINGNKIFPDDKEILYLSMQVSSQSVMMFFVPKDIYFWNNRYFVPEFVDNSKLPPELSRNNDFDLYQYKVSIPEGVRFWLSKGIGGSPTSKDFIIEADIFSFTLSDLGGNRDNFTIVSVECIGLGSNKELRVRNEYRFKPILGDHSLGFYVMPSETFTPSPETITVNGIWKWTGADNMESQHDCVYTIKKGETYTNSLPIMKTLLQGQKSTEYFEITSYSPDPSEFCESIGLIN